MDDAVEWGAAGHLDRKLARARVPLGFVCGAIVLWFAKPDPGLLMAGLPIAVAGERLRVWAAGHLEKSREVTQSGSYASCAPALRRLRADGHWLVDCFGEPVRRGLDRASIWSRRFVLR